MRRRKKTERRKMTAVLVDILEKTGLSAVHSLTAREKAIVGDKTSLVSTSVCFSASGGVLV